MIIYKTTNLVNGKIYVGKSVKDTDASYLGSGLFLKKAIKKYGRAKFKKEILEICTAEIMNEREIFWIRELDARNLEVGYNICEGGRGALGRLMTEETRKRVSRALKGVPLTPEHKQRIREGLAVADLSWSPEKRARASVNWKGRGLGRKVSDSVRKHLSRVARGVPKTLGHVMKISQALLGVSKSPEHVQAMKDAWVLRKLRNHLVVEGM